MAAAALIFLSGLTLSVGSSDANAKGPSATFRCGDDFVSVGENMAEVILRCGEPTFRQTTGAKGKARTIKGKRAKAAEGDQRQEGLSRKKKGVVTKTEYEEKVSETWYYNRGSNDFVYSLHFEGGVLTKIVEGNRGL